MANTSKVHILDAMRGWHRFNLLVDCMLLSRHVECAQLRVIPPNLDYFSVEYSPPFLVRTCMYHERHQLGDTGVARLMTTFQTNAIWETLDNSRHGNAPKHILWWMP